VKPSRSEVYECRHMGHSWDDLPVTERPPWGVYMWFRCTRCGTERYDIINQFTGELMNRRYHWPDWYKLTKDERPSIEELRQFQFKLTRKRKRERRKTG
jgi:hypothetical protein